DKEVQPVADATCITNADFVEARPGLVTNCKLQPERVWHYAVDRLSGRVVLDSFELGPGQFLGFDDPRTDSWIADADFGDAVKVLTIDVDRDCRTKWRAFDVQEIKARRNGHRTVDGINGNKVTDFSELLLGSAARRRLRSRIRLFSRGLQNRALRTLRGDGIA